MSASHEQESWLERWGLVLVIVYGLAFVTTILTFSPKI
jgi:membrane protein YqaA with SNARE-associated domain